MSKRVMLVLLLISLMILVPVSEALSGGGPGAGGPGPEGCWAYFIGNDPNVHLGSVTDIYAGQVLDFNVMANCPVAISNTWNSEIAAVTQYDIDNSPYGWSDFPMMFTTDPNMAPSAGHHINLTFEVDPTVTYQYIRVIIGELPPLDLQLSLAMRGARWASYADYQSRHLTVGYRITNTGTNEAYNVMLTGATATNGVTLSTECSYENQGDCYPRYLMDTLSGGATVDFSSRFVVPPGTANFRTTVTMEAVDYNNQLHYFPPGSPPPTP